MGKSKDDGNPEYAIGGMIPEDEELKQDFIEKAEAYMLDRSTLVPKNSDAPHPDMDPPPPEPTLSELAALKPPGGGIVVPPPKATRQEAVVIEGVFHGMRDVEE